VRGSLRARPGTVRDGHLKIPSARVSLPSDGREVLDMEEADEAPGK
jgi:hypothetical protein